MQKKLCKGSWIELCKHEMILDSFVNGCVEEKSIYFNRFEHGQNKHGIKIHRLFFIFFFSTCLFFVPFVLERTAVQM